MKIILLTLAWLLTSNLSFGQNSTEFQFRFENSQLVFSTKDTVRISFELDSLELLYSNFGGYKWDFVYHIICHSDSLQTRGAFPSSDYLLTEYNYTNTGNIEFTLDLPGIYSVQFFYRKQNAVEVDPFEQTIFTQPFEIIPSK